MKARTRPSCLACAALFDAARPARGGWRFFDPCPGHDPNSPENIEKAARAKRAADSAGEVIEPTPSPDPEDRGPATRGAIARTGFAVFYRPTGQGSMRAFEMIHPQFSYCYVSRPGACVGHGAECCCATCFDATRRWEKITSSRATQ